MVSSNRAATGSRHVCLRGGQRFDRRQRRSGCTLVTSRRRVAWAAATASGVKPSWLR